MFRKIRENKILSIVGNILYAILFIIVVCMLILVVLQKTSNNSLSIGGYRIFQIASGSMEPKYNVGDILIAKETDKSELKVGDAIVYKGLEGSFKDKFVTHEIQTIEKQDNGVYKIVTKGIANIQEDPEITSDQVYGKIVYKVQTLSWLSKKISNIYVFYFLIFVPIGIIIYKQIRALIKEDDEDSEE